MEPEAVPTSWESPLRRIRQGKNSVSEWRSDMKTDNTLILNDGRQLSYAEYGDPTGKPVFYNHSGSRLDIRSSSAATAWLGIRIIALDRPGIGLSNFRPGYQFLDWPADVAEAADCLGIKRFAIFGHSIGGVFTLACAHQLAERLTRVAVIGCPSPLDAPGVMEGMHRANRALFGLARRTTWPMKVQAAISAWALKSANAERTAKRMLNLLAEPDREAIRNQPGLMEDMLDAGRESFRSGTEGAVWANTLMARPWGFALEDIQVPLTIWQGDQDTNVPLAMGEYLAQHIPGSQYRILANEGHMSSLTNHFEEILGELTGID